MGYDVQMARHIAGGYIEADRAAGPVEVVGLCIRPQGLYCERLCVVDNQLVCHFHKITQHSVRPRYSTIVGPLLSSCFHLHCQGSDHRHLDRSWGLSVDMGCLKIVEAQELRIDCSCILFRVDAPWLRRPPRCRRPNLRE